MRPLERPAPLALLLTALAAACGAPPPEPRTPAAAPGDGAADAAGATSAAACLAAAGAKRQARADEPSRIGVKQILVRHAGAERADGATRTREQACLRAMEARDKIRGGADLDAVVAEYSEEAGAASRGGSLGTIERADVLPPFADAAFELDLHQLSDVVETRYGFHVIFRTE
ncbi:peptidyl-prolyl cis-trans isomerase [Sorangium cellulosum]|uniref:peptidylprolyl isomerase n=1 Tax=Sorangium cellulosum TaxID=56 RepID=A0A2L0ETW2_SORCE|nr:peptidylprolyl isomerase [Sorangium cellulosum]AUX42725.1 peptidyl-prolyl cis-trans isomerase [Sorangium cellulosum]